MLAKTFHLRPWLGSSVAVAIPGFGVAKLAGELCVGKGAKKAEQENGEGIFQQHFFSCG